MKNILVIAPHVEANDHNGSSKYLKWIVSCIPTEFNVTVVSCGGSWTGIRSVTDVDVGFLDSVKISLFKSLISIYPYHSYRLCNSATADYLRNHRLNKFDMIIVSFIHPYFRLRSLFKLFPGKILLVTHNYDPDIYKVWGGLNIVQKMLSFIDLLKYRFASKKILNDNISFAHVAELDGLKYKNIFPNIQSFVFPPPVPIQVSSDISISDGVVRFCFVGSLTTSFNIDALKHFADKFWPILRHSLNAEFSVFGSCPSDKVKILCTEHGWRLNSDLSDEQLACQLATMDIGVMPFVKTAGTKLKLMHYFSAGCVVCCTNEFTDFIFNGQKIALASNNPNDWVDFSKEFQNKKTILKFSARHVAENEARIAEGLIKSNITNILN